MKLRAPAVPLITVDPYFSVWSMADRLTDDETRHWTGKPNTIEGKAVIDGTPYAFLGRPEGLPVMTQTNLEIDALTTAYTFEEANVRLTAEFTTPLLPQDLELLSRPLTYLSLRIASLDGAAHTAELQVRASEELCLNEKGQMPVITAAVSVSSDIRSMRMGSEGQPVLAVSGDDVRIDWGYLYLSARGPEVSVTAETAADMTFLSARAVLTTDAEDEALFAFSYDDVMSLIYFGKQRPAYWKRDGRTMEQLIAAAYEEYDVLRESCRLFAEQLTADATRAGGDKYAELLSLAWRQVLGAHKLSVDENGEVLYISKECFSNGCAATVDVSYPSIPLFLLYNPELVKGMARPIFRYLEEGTWPYDYAPHDAGQYPHLNGQWYSYGTDPTYQMPVEECGNMILMLAAVSAAEGNSDFANRHMPLLRQWAAYLIGHGTDPENQLCTDDFAGHLPHNCNLSLKAIMAIGAFSLFCVQNGDDDGAKQYRDAAKAMAAQWIKMADNGDGSFRLAFDQPGTFSMKYNMVWDKVLGLNLFPRYVLCSEFGSYRRRMQKYGLPLDSRKDYTKSDWLLWVGTMAPSREEFEEFLEPLWAAYHASPSRVPMTDWYSTVTSLQIGFQHRTVQGGLFMKLLDDAGVCRFFR